MKAKFNLSNLLYNIVACLIIALVLLAVAPPTVALAVVFILFAFSLIPQKEVSGVLRNEVLKRLFSSDLQERLYPDNTFFAGAQFDVAGIDVESIDIPQDEDGDANFVVNPTKFPLEVVVQEDKKKSYGADLIATTPELVTDLNQALVSYDKRAAKLRKHQNTLETQIANRILFAWAATASAYIKQTTGTATRAAHAPGATGLRKRISKEDVLYFFSMFNDLNIPMAGRRLVAPSYMYEDLLILIEEAKRGTDGVNVPLEKGAIGMIYSFSIFLRPQTPVYTEAGTPVKKAIGAASATTDNQSVVFYHPSFVRYIKGSPTVYINPGQGSMLGTTMNAALRGGGTISRLSEIGVGALVEDNA